MADFHSFSFMDTGLDHLQARSKQLPPLGFSKDDELPLPPPPISPISSDPRPSPPPKTMYEGGMGNPPIYSRDDRPPPSPQTDLPNPSFLTSPPGSPAFPGSGPVAADARPKKVNPFVDLMETEKSYVDTLSGIIRVCYSPIAFFFLLLAKSLYRKSQQHGLAQISHRRSSTRCFAALRASIRQIDRSRPNSRR